MNKFQLLIDKLNLDGVVSTKAFGNSMLPKIKSGSKLTIEKFTTYEVGDIVFCKVKGNYYFHLITKMDNEKGYLIANNKGYEKWVDKIYIR